ncbi:hypothetical protein DPMN_015351 [Dreissena polymorpha]|uniref:Uncharacterized protein n=1 Tax=Dreissena polymorpha TaxID=45954 RepID=A0A9D4N7L5_DREPO|nr:hypothetical protein DPMN_015351 [Dreissena polymorpha]
MPEIPVGGQTFPFFKPMASNYFGRMGYSLVTKGLTFQFEKRPSLSHVPIELVSQHPHIPQSILGLLEKQAVERVQDPYSPGFYSRLFLVQNKNGSWRPVIDLKVLNMYLLKPTFKMETFPSYGSPSNTLHWGVSWIWKMRTSMFLYIPTSGSTFDLPFMAKSTSSGPCHLGWRPPHEFLPN